ncbi:tetraspanin15 [Hibiscus trionum]|uniref:Tetraspanin15 n=1 Tax=Hibiscus trionum TaxID=183268 RepID=A0A9W7M3R8_HIBTR|nr:tetraspanin15 [Hibiscus trionum]
MADEANTPEATPMADTQDNKQAPGSKKNVFKLLRVKHVTGILSLASFVFSIPILASVTWLLYMKSYDCEWLFKLPRLQIGISIGLIFVFLICNGALFLRSRLPMVGIIAVMVPLTLMFTVGLALLGANSLESRKIPATPLWFRMKADDDGLWNNIKGCIYDVHVCQDLAASSKPVKSYDFDKKKLSSVESGCCIPPEECHMQYVNATFWQKDENATESSGNADCDAWSNDRGVLCYNCQSCKEGYVKALRSKWSKLGVFLVSMAVFLITCHLALFLATMWELHCTS